MPDQELTLTFEFSAESLEPFAQSIGKTADELSENERGLAWVCYIIESLDPTKANEHYAEALGRSVDELTAEEKRAALHARLRVTM